MRLKQSKRGFFAGTKPLSDLNCMTYLSHVTPLDCNTRMIQWGPTHDFPRPAIDVAELENKHLIYVNSVQSFVFKKPTRKMVVIISCKLGPR